MVVAVKSRWPTATARVSLVVAPNQHVYDIQQEHLKQEDDFQKKYLIDRDLNDKLWPKFATSGCSSVSSTTNILLTITYMLIIILMMMLTRLLLMMMMTSRHIPKYPPDDPIRVFWWCWWWCWWWWWWWWCWWWGLVDDKLGRVHPTSSPAIKPSGNPRKAPSHEDDNKDQRNTEQICEEACCWV